MTEQWKPGTGQFIETLYAWIAEEPDGSEGIISVKLGGMSVEMPLVGADKERIESLRRFAEHARSVSSYPIRLVHFSHRQVLETLP